MESIYKLVNSMDDEVKLLKNDFSRMVNLNERMSKLEKTIAGVLVVNGIVLSVMTATLVSIVEGLFK